MDVLATCARCKRLFTKSDFEVCANCRDAELADYDKIRNALAENESLSAAAVAELTGVSLACVLRMVEHGGAKATSAEEQLRCGMCGAPAISARQRICESCLKKLDLEVSVMRERVLEQQGKAHSSMSGVHRTVEKKRRN